MSIPTIWHPMPMTDMLVRETEAGRKTETRRIAKIPISDHQCPVREIVPSLLLNDGDLWDVRYEIDNPRAIRCPYGAPGHGLWIRQAWTGEFAGLDRSDTYMWHETPKEHRTLDRCVGVFRRSDPDFGNLPLKWVPPMFMPRWACRLFVEVTGIRLERLQEIDDAAIRREGIAGLNLSDIRGMGIPLQVLLDAFDVRAWRGQTAIDHLYDRWVQAPLRKRWITVWDSINGHRPGASWEASPWVWVVSYRMLDTADVLASAAWTDQMRKGDR